MRPRPILSRRPESVVEFHDYSHRIMWIIANGRKSAVALPPSVIFASAAARGAYGRCANDCLSRAPLMLSVTQARADHAQDEQAIKVLNETFADGLVTKDPKKRASTGK